MAKKQEVTQVQIVEARKGRVEFCILGTTPLICNRMSEKAMRQLVFPPDKTRGGTVRDTLKHDPYREFLDAAYMDEDPKGPTLITHLATAFKKSMSGAALDIPGATKSQIGRLCWVEGERIPIYGIPEMFMSVTRNSDPKRTPDVRTRVIFPKWACRIVVSFYGELLNATSVTNLLATAGMIQGVGDWRTEKGSGTYGSFEIVSDSNPEFRHLLKHGIRKAQQAAMDNPEPYDRETQDLYAFVKAEATKRGKSDKITSHAAKTPKARAVKAVA